MSEPLMWVVFGCYFLATLDLLMDSRHALAMIFAGYALAQIGMVLVIRG